MVAVLAVVAMASGGCGSGARTATFADRPLLADDAVGPGPAPGGIRCNRGPRQPGADCSSSVRGMFRDRAIEIATGASRGGLVWRDPDADGVRPNNLYWEDAQFADSMIAVRPAEEIVNLARGIACR